MELHERIIEIAMNRAFVIPSAEIYSPPAGFYDYGPVGCNLKRKLENFWRDFFVKREGFLEVESSYILPEAVLEASGHCESFADPFVECRKCKRKFRKEDAKGACPECGGETADAGWFNLMFKTEIGPVGGEVGYIRPETAQGIFINFARVVRNFGSKLPIGIAQIGKSFRNEISPRQGLVRMREFSQMELEYFFDPSAQAHPKFGEIAGAKMRIYTREEQAKGSGKCEEKSIGEFVSEKAIPNEIMGYFLAREQEFYGALGISYENMRFRHLLKEETPHYSSGNIDLEIKTSYGWVEVIGTAYRSDFDLKRHSEKSGKEMCIFDEAKGKIFPHVVEPSFGVDRTIWCLLEHSYRKGKGQEELQTWEGASPSAVRRDWEWFAFPPRLSPFVAVFPLMKKPELAEKAEALADALRKEGLDVLYDAGGSIGKRYAKADEIGVAYCITVDYESLKDDSVTVRFRNDGKQAREKIPALAQALMRFIGEGKVSL